MSWFKRQNPKEMQAASPMRNASAAGNSVRRQGGNQRGASATTPTRPRSGTDPETCLEVFKNHWLQAVTIMNKTNACNPGTRRSGLQEEVNAVRSYVDQMMLLLIEEKGEGGQQGLILEYLLSEDILEKVLIWSSRTAEFADKLKLQQLKMFEALVSQARQPLLVHKPIIRPLLKLLCGCAEHPNKVIENHVILLVHQLCVCLTRDVQLLELLFDASADHGPARFLIFSLLIPYVHREGSIGQQARDALLLIMALSSKHENIGRYIAQNSDFCPVLATGLSGLYSSLPQTLDIPADDWFRLHDEDVQAMPDLIMFLNSLEFCNAVVQVAHPLVREQLLTFIYNGFLVPVIGPALHQNQDYILKKSTLDFTKLPVSVVESYFGSSMEEVVAATAYLELFIRRITEPALIQTFLRFILTEKHDDLNILESLVSRINSHSRMCMVSLSLFWTLVDLNCEDVMYQLVFRYLIPCTHVMVSQRRSVRDLDMYSRTADKFLSLTPACCLPDMSDTPPDGAGTPVVPGSPCPSSSSFDLSLSEDVSLPRSPDSASSASSTYSTPSTPEKSKFSFLKKRYHWKPKNARQRTASDLTNNPAPDDDSRSSSPDGASSRQIGLGSKLEHYETNYMEYLETARKKIGHCAVACQCWSHKYDGEDPPTDSVQTARSPGEETITSDNTVDSTVTTPMNPEGVQPPFPGSHALAGIAGVSERQHSLDSPSGEPSPISLKDKAEDSGEESRICSGGVDEALPSSHGMGEDNLEEGEVDSKSESGDCSKLSNQLRDSYAESVTSEADSALSNSSVVTDSIHNGPDHPSPSCDSPLNDSFDTADFNKFLLSLKRVKTPVEFCDSIEDSMHEIDTLINDLKTSEIRSRSRTLSSGEGLPKFTDSSEVSSADVIKPNAAKSDPKESKASKSTGDGSSEQDSTNIQTKPRSVSECGAPLEKVDKSVEVRPTRAVSMPAAPGSEQPGSGTIQPTSGPLRPAGSLPLMPLLPAFGPNKYGMGTPNIGPFLSTLLGRLEMMMSNTLYVNLLLTGLLSQLACYPQPLLRSFLLNHNLVFQPTVKSLGQVLGSVKHKVDCYSYTVKDFESLLLKARRFLVWREDVYHFGEGGRQRSDSTISLPPTRPRGSSSADSQKEKRRGSVLDNFFRRNTTTNKTKSIGSRLQLLGGGQGFRYINRTGSTDGNKEQSETAKTKNAVYCALVLEEFLKELAAVSQEHGVLCVEEELSSITS